MNINLVLQLRNTIIPKSVTNSSVYAVVTRRSLLGFHKQYRYHGSFDSLCTKTELLFFTSENHAKDFSSILEKSHQNMVRFTRDITYENYNVAKIDGSLNFDIGINNGYADTIKPIDIELIPYDYVEKLCLLHYFDMLLAYDMNIIEHDKNKYDILFECFQYRTLELPSRAVQEKMFRDMLYKQ